MPLLECVMHTSFSVAFYALSILMKDSGDTIDGLERWDTPSSPLTLLVVLAALVSACGNKLPGRHHGRDLASHVFLCYNHRRADTAGVDIE